MPTYYVIKNDNPATQMIRGCHVSVNPQSFRKVPIHAVIWTEKVSAATPEKAVDLAYQARYDNMRWP